MPSYNRHITGDTTNPNISSISINMNVNLVVLCPFTSVLFTSNIINVNTYQYHMRLNHDYVNVPYSSPLVLFCVCLVTESVD